MMDVANDPKSKFKHQIGLALERKLSWEDLTLILEALTPTFISMKHLIEVLIQELRHLQEMQIKSLSIKKEVEQRIDVSVQTDENESVAQASENRLQSSFGHNESSEEKIDDHNSENELNEFESAEIGIQ